MWLRSWEERTPQRCVGVLARLLGHDLAPQATGPRLDGAVSAHVDPRPQPALAAQLEAVGDLLDRLEAPHARVDRTARGAAGERAGALLDQSERRVERSGVEPLDSWAAADDDSVCHGRDGAVPGFAAWAACAASASRAPASSASAGKEAWPMTGSTETSSPASSSGSSSASASRPQTRPTTSSGP